MALVAVPASAVAATASHAVPAHAAATTSAPSNKGIYTPYYHDWVNPDGSHTRVIGEGPIFYPDASGVWHGIDVHPVQGSGGSYSPKADNTGVAIGAAANATVVSVQTRAGTIRLIHPGAAAVGAKADPDGFDLDFPGALASKETLKERFSARGFDESVVVASAADPASYSERFILPSGVVAKALGSGVGFYDGSGSLLGSFGSAYALDSSEGGSITAASVSLVSDHGDTATVSVTVPDQWLSAPARTFPVTIDPTYSVYTGPADGSCWYGPGMGYGWSSYNGCDDYVASDNVGGQYSAQDFLRVGSPATCDNGASYTTSPAPCGVGNDSAFTIDRTLMQFDTSGLGTSSCDYVENASLGLDLYTYSVPGYTATAHTYYFYGLGSGFGEFTDWSNQPGLDGYSPSSLSTSPGGPYNLDVTPVVSRWFGCGESSYGIEMQADYEQDPTAWREFYSSDYGYGYGPSLTVNYIAPPSAPTSVSASASTKAVSVTWGPPSDAGGGSISEYEVYLSNGQYQYVCGSCYSASFGGLVGNTTYTATVYADNQAGWGPGAAASATTPVNLPSAPQNVVASFSGTTLDASWAQPADTGGAGIGIQAYQVSLSDGESATLSGSTYSYSFPGLSPGATYTLSVQAENEVGWGPSASATATAPTSVPTAPTYVNLDQFGNLAWGTPVSDGGLAITSYTITPYDLTSGSAVAGAALSCAAPCNSTALGLTDGQTYYVSVSATNGDGSGPATDSGEVVYQDPSGLDTAAQGNITGPVNQCHAGDPFDCATGDYYDSATDDAIPGRGLNLDLSRTYNSLAAGTAGPFGYGWTFSYGMSAAIGSSTVSITQENGSQVAFTKTASGWVAPPRALATLSVNAAGDYVFVRRQRETFTFSSTGQLLSESDLNGYQTDLIYSGSQLVQVTDPEGRWLSFAYNTAGQISGVTDSAGRSVAYAYDANGNLASVTDLDGNTTSYTYDSAHHLLSRTDPNGGVLANTYDSSGRILTQTDPMGRTTTLAYSSAATYGPSTTTVTDALGNVEVQTYDNNVLMSVTRAEGTSQAATTTYAYASGILEPSSVTDPDGHVSSTVYDSAGDVLSQTDALNRTTTYTYDGLGDLTSVTDPMSHQTTYAYDGSGNLLSVSRPVAETGQTQKTTYSYTDGYPGDVTAVTDPLGDVSSYAYDAYGDLIAETNPVGGVTTYTYDPAGRQLSAVAPKGNLTGADPASFTTSYAYDPAGDVLSSTDPLGDVTKMTYDGDHNLVTTTTPMGQKTTNGYDADNELVSVTEPNGAVVSYGYDADGNRTSYTDGDGHRTTYAYDALGRQTTSTDALGRTTKTAYDPAGNVTSVTNPSGQTTSRSYDAANQLSGVRYSDGATPGDNFSYNPDGQLVGESETNGWSRNYTYDSLNRLVSNTDTTPATTGTRTESVSYGYDLANRVTTLSPTSYLGTAYTFSRTYDSAGEMTSVSDGKGNTTTFSYDANGNLTGEAYPNGTAASYGYDNADRLTMTTDIGKAGAFLSLPSPRDADGRVTSQNQTGTGPGSALTLGYDSNSRLATATSSTATSEAYTYDNADLLTSKTTPAGSASFSYDAADQLVSRSGTTATGISTSTSYVFNAEGDRTTQSLSLSGPTGASLATAGFTYNQANQLTGYTGPPISTFDGATSGSTVTESFSYDPQGLRTDLGWDLAEGMALVVLDQTGNAYVTGPGGVPVEEIAAEPGGGSQPFLYFHHDSLGSTRAVTTEGGSLAGLYVYDSYGNVTPSSGAPAVPFLFAGQYTDLQSGLIYMRARWYDPGTGQFLSRDPLQQVTGEPYQYVGDDPTTAKDPEGLATVGYCVAAVASFIGSVGGEGCLTRVISGGSDEIGVTGSYQFGGGPSAGLNLGAAVQISNATSLSQLQGPFIYLQLSAGVPPEQGTIVLFIGEDSQGKTIYGADIGGGVGINLTDIFAALPISVSAGWLDTSVHQFGGLAALFAKIAWDAIGQFGPITWSHINQDLNQALGLIAWAAAVCSSAS